MISTWRFPRIDHSPHQHYCRWLWRSFPRTSPTGFCGWIAMPWWPTAPFPSRISCRPTWSRKMPISWWPRTATAGCWWCGMVRNGADGFMSWEILAPNPYIYHLIIRRRQASTLAFSCCVGVKWDCDSWETPWAATGVPEAGRGHFLLCFGDTVTVISWVEKILMISDK